VWRFFSMSVSDIDNNTASSKPQDFDSLYEAPKPLKNWGDDESKIKIKPW